MFNGKHLKAPVVQIGPGAAPPCFADASRCRNGLRSVDKSRSRTDADTSRSSNGSFCLDKFMCSSAPCGVDKSRSSIGF
jgi:hypothetical protein